MRRQFKLLEALLHVQTLIFFNKAERLISVISKNTDLVECN